VAAVLVGESIPLILQREVWEAVAVQLTAEEVEVHDWVVSLSKKTCWRSRLNSGSIQIVRNIGSWVVVRMGNARDLVETDFVLWKRMMSSV